MNQNPLFKIHSLAHNKFPIGLVGNIQGNAKALREILCAMQQRGIEADRVISLGNLVGKVKNDVEVYQIAKNFLANLTGTMELSILLDKPLFPLCPPEVGSIFMRLKSTFTPEHFSGGNWFGPRIKVGKHVLSVHLSPVEFFLTRDESYLEGSYLWPKSTVSSRPARLITSYSFGTRSREVLGEEIKIFLPDCSEELVLDWDFSRSTAVSIGASGFYRNCQIINRACFAILDEERITLYSIPCSLSDLIHGSDFDLM